jgi:hypothetical protein
VLQRAQANLAAVQYEALVAPHWGKLQWGGGSPDAFEAVLKGLGEWTADYLPDFMTSGKEFGVGDIKLGPFVVSPRCERQPGDRETNSLPCRLDCYCSASATSGTGRRVQATR